MSILLYQVNAFTHSQFKGNPAAVCVLDEWLEDIVLQNIAAENNLPDTAFICRKGERYDLRWFTPVVEVDLCGHATLASAYVIFEFLEPDKSLLVFSSKSGELRVSRDQTGYLFLDFPARPATPTEWPSRLAQALGVEPLAVLLARDLLVVLPTWQQVQNLQPDMQLLSEIKTCFAVIVTAKGENVDFVSRFFAPNAGIPEDPVTGSAHCTLVPYWAQVLGKTQLKAHQLSVRGGELLCELKGDRVLIGGAVQLFMRGTIFLSQALYR